MILGGAILILTVLSILLFKGGEIDTGLIFGGLDAFLIYFFIEVWNENRREKEKRAFETGGENYGKIWITKRRTIRFMVVSAVFAASATVIIAGMHEVVRRNLYEDALGKYRKGNYQGSLSQFYVDARLAMGLDKEGWVSAYITIERKMIGGQGSVGNSIVVDCYVNGEQVESGDTAMVQVYGKNSIKSIVTEIDPSENDVGKSTDYVFISPQDLQNGEKFSHTVTVYERNGRYAGSYREEQITYRIKAVRRLDLSALDILRNPLMPGHEVLKKPKIEDIPDSYLYTFSHNVLGQFVLAAILTMLYRYWSHTYKKDNKLLAEKLEDAERAVRAAARIREWEQMLIREKEAAEAARLEEQRRLQARRKEAEENRLDAIADAAYAYAMGKEKMRAALQEHTLEEIAGVPKKVKFTKDLLPYDEGFPGEYGHFSVYVTTEGKRFHAQKSCHGAWKEIHMFKAIEDRKSPCSICARKYPYSIPEWYEKYKDQLKKKEYYNL